MSFETRPLEDWCELVVDCPHSTPEWTETGVVVLRSQNIKNGRLDLTNPSYTTEAGYKGRTKRATPRAGDLVITREAPMGEICRVPDGLRCCLGQRQVLLRPKANSDYLLYAIQSPYVQKQIRGHDATGSTVSNLCIPDLKALRIPDLINVAALAKVLTTLDAKIELNNRINEELEGMAKLLYDYWFVQFDFPMTAAQAAALGKPHLTGHPYRASGGKMIYNQTLKREIPEGWKMSSVKDFAPVLTGKEDANHATQSGEFHFFTCGEQNLRCDDFKYDGKAVLVAGNGNFSVKFFEGRFNAYQRTYVLIPNDEAHFALIYFAIFDSIKGLTLSSQGSIIKFLTKGNIEDIAIPLPTQADTEKFWESLNTILSNILVNRKQNQELTQLRDWLLPMLMNGQVTVGTSEG